jgi:hypothetical protein
MMEGKPPERHPMNSSSHASHHHSVRRMSRITHIISLLSTTVLYFLFLLYAANDFSPLFRSMHAGEAFGSDIHPPRSYLTLDWIMHPETGHKHTVTSYGVTETCQSNGPNADTGIVYCEPQYWQKTDMCDLAGSAVKTDKVAVIAAPYSDVDSTKANSIIKQVLPTDTDKRDNMIVDPDNSANLEWASPLMKESCEIERVGKFFVYQNDMHSFSLASAHSSDLLVAAAVSTLWLTNVFQVINSYMMGQTHHYAGFAKLLAVLIAILCPILLRLIVSSQHIAGTTLFMHHLPNGSYFYIIVAVVWVAWIGFRRSLFCRACFMENVDGHETAMLTAQTGYVENTREDTTEMSELDTGSFTSHKLKTGAYMPRSASKDPNSFAGSSNMAIIYASNFEFQNTQQCMEMHTESMINFELAQLFTLPLLLLGIFVQYNNFELDSRLQMLALAAFAYGLIDVFVRRLFFIVNIADALANYKFLGMAGSKNNYMKADSCRKSVIVIENLCILVQLLLAFVIFFCMRWHLSNSAVVGTRQVNPLLDSYIRERMLDGTGFAFVLYVILSSLVKFGSSFYHQKVSHAYCKLFLFVLFVIFFNFCAWYMYATHKNFGEGGVLPDSSSFYHKRVSYFQGDTMEVQRYTFGEYISGWEIST